MENFTIQNEFTANKCIIKVAGAGGGGGNAVNRMLDNGLTDVEFYAMNTDIQVLTNSRATNKVQLGIQSTKGLGAGGNPTIGERAANEARDEIMAALKGADMVFITAGMGGGTGTGAAPVIAEIAQAENILTVAVVTKPFSFEGKLRMRQAEIGIKNLAEHVDSMIVIENNKLISMLDKKVGFDHAFRVADEILARAVECITTIITEEGLINLDFADVKSVMTLSKRAIMGMGMSQGEGRAIEAARKAIHSPLSQVTFDNAMGLIVNISGGNDLTLSEINDAMNIINAACSEDTNVIFGANIDDRIKSGYMSITVIATGLEEQIIVPQKKIVFPEPEIKNEIPKKNVDLPQFTTNNFFNIKNFKN